MTKLKFATWNIDTNLARTEEGYARESHPQWRVGARMPEILNKVKGIDSDIFAIQELRTCTTKHNERIDSTTPVKEFFEQTGYSVRVTSYRPGEDLAFKFILAYKERFEFVNEKLKFFTQTPDESTSALRDKGATKEEITKHNFGALWETSTPVISLKDTETDEELCIMNIHLGILLETRLASSKLIVEFAEEQIALNKDVKIIIAGDFNSFPQDGGDEQMAIICSPDNNVQLVDITDNMKLPDGTSVSDTFFAFPFDFSEQDKEFRKDGTIEGLYHTEDPAERKTKIGELFSKCCMVINGHLDHIITYNLKAESVTLDVSPLLEPYPEDYKEETIKEYVMSHHDDGPAFASDHQAVVTILGGE